MAMIAQNSLFSWDDVNDLREMHRLRLVTESLEDEGLMRGLERRRGKGRNDYPIRAMWNSLLAGVVFQHDSVASLRRELKRNGELRQECGFDPLKGMDGVPSAWAYTRFLRLLMGCQEEVEAMFEGLVERLREVLPDFGRILAVDGKAIASHGNRRKANAPRAADGRRDLEANVGVKTYRGRREDGTEWEKVKKWFGYKLHLVVDAEYELPVAFELTRASAAEQPVARELVRRMGRRQEALVAGCEALLGDKGYDDGALIGQLWDEHGIKPVIDIRNCWQRPDAGDTRVLEGTTNVIYDYRGNVSCSCPRTGEVRAMAYGGFEKQRGTLKYRCPAAHYGAACQGRSECPLAASSSHSVGRRPAGVHSGGAIELCVEGTVQETHGRGASE